jgi:hypothetical protein
MRTVWASNKCRTPWAAVLWSFALPLATVSQCAAQRGVGDGITATAEIKGQAYCLGDTGIGFLRNSLPPDAITLWLKVILTYRNASSQPQIVQTGPRFQIVISSTVRDAEVRRNQTVTPYGGQESSYTLEDRSTLESVDQPSPPFIIVQPAPNGIFKLATDVALQIHNGTVKTSGIELLGRKILFQLDLNHAIFPDEILRDLAAKWRSYGTLWAAAVRTQPLEIDIPKFPKTERCPSGPQVD